MDIPMESGGLQILDQIKWNADGLVPAIIQEESSGRVLMMAWMNRASLEKTMETRRTFFWSRSRKRFWMKGESSGHIQEVQQVTFDCDADTLLIQVRQTGAACHEGYLSCFFREIRLSDGQVEQVDVNQLVVPEDVYGGGSKGG